ncbi:MAG: heavy-metal-associated domain-containing protein [Muribaculaceae bacterium]|nr:heavy-metal-associated domain-containing protein [Muribaculaceae bacterium]MDE6793634.1 heavy-metal-associated domain-containing protein [Muribaculaceae bacterium]
MFVLTCTAKDLKTLRVTTQPPMTCVNCENKIKKNIRFEKGVKEISTDLKGQVVTIIYDADKTDTDKIVKAFDKIKYKVTVLKEQAPDECGTKEEN